MGKSRQKHPHFKIGGNSDKKSRTIANKKLRKINKQRLKQDPLSGEFKLLREVSDTWNFASDGLAYYSKNYDKKRLKK